MSLKERGRKQSVGCKAAKASAFWPPCKIAVFSRRCATRSKFRAVAHLRDGDTSALYDVYAASRRCAKSKCASSGAFVSAFHDAICITAPKMRSLLRAFFAHLRENTAIFHSSRSRKKWLKDRQGNVSWISFTRVWEGNLRE